MPAIRRVTLTYTESIQLAPYNTVSTGLVVEVEPDIEDGPDAVRDLASLIESTWSIVGPATHRQVRAAVEEFEALQGERRQRVIAGDAPLRDGGGSGASHTPVEPSPATAKQREAIAGLKSSLNWSDADLAAFAQQLGVDIATLNRGEASALLTAMQSQPRKQASRSPAPASDREGFPAREGEAPEPASPAGPPSAPPRSPEEAEQRFFARYGDAIGGATLADVRRFLGQPRLARPTTVEAWVALAEEVRDRIREAEQASA